MRAPLNETRVVLASAARTASVNSDPQDNQHWRGGHFIVDVSAVAATPSVVFTIQGYDPAADDWYDLLASAAITGTGKTVLRLYPGLTAVANETVSDVLPGKWRVEAVNADADSITYSVVAHLAR